MGSFYRLAVFLGLLHIASTAEAWVDLLRIQANIPNATTDHSADTQARLSALEESVARQLTTMQAQLKEFFEKRSSDTDRTLQIRDIVKDISQGGFTFADGRLIDADDTAAVAVVLRDVPSSSDNDFGTLLNLASRLTKPHIKSLILTRLYDEVERNEHISTAKLIELAKVSPETTRLEALLGRITAEVTATLVEAMKQNATYQENQQAMNLSASIAEWRNISERVMVDLVSGTFGSVESKQILEGVSGHIDTWQALVGVDALIERLHQSDAFKGAMVINVASHLDAILCRGNLHSAGQARALQVKEKIPGCLMSLFSLKPFCLRNEPSAQFAVRRGKDQNDTTTGRKWKAAWDGEKMSFVNELGLELWDGKTWLPEPIERNCFLRNCETKEYLYMYEKEFYSSEYVLGLMPKRRSSPAFVWEVLSC